MKADFWPAIGVILIAANLVWTIIWSIWVSRRVAAPKVAEHETRISIIETKLPIQVASHQDVERLHVRIGDVKDKLALVAEEVGEITGAVQGIRETVGTLAKLRMEGK